MILLDIGIATSFASKAGMRVPPAKSFAPEHTELTFVPATDIMLEDTYCREEATWIPRGESCYRVPESSAAQVK
jgi:hypothetical protein